MAEGYKWTPEEEAKAKELFLKVKERRAKAKEKRKALTPEQKAERKQKGTLRRCRTQLIAVLAAKAGINPSAKEVREYAKKKYPDVF